EIVKYPFFAWAGEGDRLTTLGRWIWDCGHPDPDPLGSCSISAQDCIVDSDCLPGEMCVGTVFNYHSEIHPPQAVAVSRIGGGAGDRCVVTHHDNPFDQATIDCFPLSQPLANVNASNVAFDIPLPPRPPGSPRPRVKVFDQTPAGLPRPRVTTTFVDGTPPVVHAVIDMTTPIAGMLPSRVGKTIFARWLSDPTPMARVRLTVTAIEILNALKPVHPVAT